MPGLEYENPIIPDPTIRVVGSARIQDIQDSEYAVSADLGGGDFDLMDKETGRHELWHGQDSPPASFCLKHENLYLEFVRGLDHHDPAATASSGPSAPSAAVTDPNVTKAFGGPDGAGFQVSHAGQRQLISFMTLRATLEPESMISNRYKAAVGFHGDPIDPISFKDRKAAEKWILGSIREELGTHLEDQGVDPADDARWVGLRDCASLADAEKILSNRE